MCSRLTVEAIYIYILVSYAEYFNLVSYGVHEQ